MEQHMCWPNCVDKQTLIFLKGMSLKIILHKKHEFTKWKNVIVMRLKNYITQDQWINKMMKFNKNEFGIDVTQ